MLHDSGGIVEQRLMKKVHKLKWLFQTATNWMGSFEGIAVMRNLNVKAVSVLWYCLQSTDLRFAAT